MSHAKRTVVEHATAAELPPRFRGDFEPGTQVTVIVAEKEPLGQSKQSKYLRCWGIAADRNNGIEDAVARIRELRDEWDERRSCLSISTPM